MNYNIYAEFMHNKGMPHGENDVLMDFLAKKWVLDGYEVMQKLDDYRHTWGLMAVSGLAALLYHDRGTGTYRDTSLNSCPCVYEPSLTAVCLDLNGLKQCSASPARGQNLTTFPSNFTFLLWPRDPVMDSGQPPRQIRGL